MTVSQQEAARPAEQPAGDYDIVREVMTQGNNAMTFWKVNMKPGRDVYYDDIAKIVPAGPAPARASAFKSLTR